MKPLDRFLQRWRIRKATPFIAPQARVLDIGCADGVLSRLLANKIEYCVGLDPHLTVPVQNEKCRLVRGFFPQALGESPPFDAITLLAVFEHLTEEEKTQMAQDCRNYLKENGRVILTVPSRYVDAITTALKWLGLIDGMDLAGHHHFDARRTPQYFEKAGFKTAVARRFQWGLNHLFVFHPAIPKA